MTTITGDSSAVAIPSTSDGGDAESGKCHELSVERLFPWTSQRKRQRKLSRAERGFFSLTAVHSVLSLSASLSQSQSGEGEELRDLRQGDFQARRCLPSLSSLRFASCFAFAFFLFLSLSRTHSFAAGENKVRSTLFFGKRPWIQRRRGEKAFPCTCYVCMRNRELLPIAR